MKNLFLAIIIFLSLSGCSFFQKQEPVPPVPAEETILERKIGLIQAAHEVGDPLPVPPEDIRFVLITEAGEKINIESLSVNLRRYKKRRVEIEGKWDDARTAFAVENIVSLGNESNIKELYQNVRLGVKFYYPSVWVLKEEKNITGLSKIIITPYEAAESERVDRITIEKSENNLRSSPREWLNLDEQYRSIDPLDQNIVYQQSVIGVAQLDAVKKTFGTGETIEFFVARDTAMYKFSHASVGDSDRDIYRNIFFEIVQGFEFVPFGERESVSTSVPSPAPAQAGSISEPVAVKEEKKGMTQLFLKMLKVSIQYPSNWYWAYSSGGYNFSNKPVESDNVLLRLTKNPDALPENMLSIGDLGGRPAIQGEMADAVTICLQEEDKTKYCLSGEPGREDIMKAMLETLITNATE